MVLGYLMSVVLIGVMGPMMTQFIHLEMGPPVIGRDGSADRGARDRCDVARRVVAGRGRQPRPPLERLRPAVIEGTPSRIGGGTITGACLIVLAALGLISGNSGLAGLGGLMLLVGMVLVAPALVEPIASVFSALIAATIAREGTGTLAQSNLTRHPGRAAITASATKIGLAIIVGMGGLIWSLTGGLWIFAAQLGSDYLDNATLGGRLEQRCGRQARPSRRLRAVSGVELVSTMRFAAATVNGKAVSLLGIDPVIYPRVASLTFQEGDSHSAFKALPMSAP